MKKIAWILIAFIVALLMGVVAFVNHDINKRSDNTVETSETMEYTITIIDEKKIEQIMDEYDISSENVSIDTFNGYASYIDGEFKGFVDAEGNTYNLEE